MKFACTFLFSVVVGALLTACATRPSALQSSSPAELGHFKQALIEYIDAHPGFFIGRTNSEGLKDKPLVVLESPEPERRYSLEEFIIVPRRMQFQANYGFHGREPYSYSGEFTNSANGRLEVGEVKLMRFHVLPQPDAGGTSR